MIQAQDTKLVFVLPPGAKVDDASAATASIDTEGYDYVQIVVGVGDTDIAFTALKVQESDDDGSDDDYADIEGLRFGIDADIEGDASALPSADDDDTLFVAELSLVGRKRYLDLVATVGDGTTGAYVTAVAILSRAKISPETNADRGVKQVLRA